MGSNSEVDREQAAVDALYARLDELRARTEESLARIRRSRAVGSPQNRSERDAFATLYEDRLVQLQGVEERLCFGRLDLRDGRSRYVGRIGLSDDEQRQLLVDWRAPAAEPFYQATAASPGDVVRRRHIAARGRKVFGVEDEVLDLDRGAARDGGLVLNGEGALMAALAARRTGRMRDIVSTIQAEQDRVIRAPLDGVLVVEGGPGTGKTAVALHRAAYLLYTHRERIARSGVLLVGPSPLFLRYIEQVLPSLGETGAVMCTPGQLFPGVDGDGAEDPRAAAVKGDLRMARVIARAVAARQRVPDRPLPLDVDGTRIVLSPAVVASARTRARQSGKPHNAARERFVRAVLDDLVDRLAAAQGVEPDEETRPRLLGELRDSADVRREVNLCWMPLTPQRLLADLWADPARLARAAPELSAAERALLRRDRGVSSDTGWTAADVPLLDEAAELLGEDDAAERAEQRRKAAERAAEVRYAQGVLAATGGSGGLVSAELLADRFADTGPALTVAERAARDRTWAYGHVVVDEAQELTAMAWRVLMRRCPSRSMTVVGDPAQTASTAAAPSWAEALDPYVAGRWRSEELTVSYRTPAEILSVATDVLAAAGVAPSTLRAARSGERPVAVPVTASDATTVDAVLREELSRLQEGRLAVVTPRHGYETLSADLAARHPDGVVASSSTALDAPVAVIDVGQVKGLEFDVVILIEPAAVLAQSDRGVHDLYVALTRPTQRLVVVHARPLPASLQGAMSSAASLEPADRAS